MSEEKVTLSDGKEAARQQILDLVAEYCDKYHNQKKEFTEGQRIPYASRVYDNHEMVNLVDSALEFWLTSGRYTDQFEAGLANYLGVKYCSLVNSGSSANLIAFLWIKQFLIMIRYFFMLNIRNRQCCDIQKNCNQTKSSPAYFFLSCF